jgi:cytoskeletal protein CcmA (bactofilin family)
MFNNSSLYIEGSAHANNVLQLNGSYMTVTGTAEAVSNFYCYGSLITIDTARGASTTVYGSDVSIQHRINSPAPVVGMPDFSDQVQAAAGQVYSGYTMFYGTNINLDSPIYVDGDLMFAGNDITGQGTILASGSIQFNGNSIVNSSDDAVCFYSRNGNIQINGSDIRLDGVLYAPNGMIQINASNVVINGRIIANTIQINGSNIQIIAGDGDLDCLPKGSIKLVE